MKTSANNLMNGIVHISEFILGEREKDKIRRS